MWSRNGRLIAGSITEGSLALSLCIPRSILPSSHNTLDTPFLIIIFITLFACLSCLSEPQLQVLLWVPFICTGCGEQCCCLCLSVTWKWRAGGGGELTHCGSLLKFITSAGEWGGSQEERVLPSLCEECRCYPASDQAHWAAAHHVTTQSLLSDHCKADEHRLCCACAFNTAVIAKVAEKFL